MKLLAALLLLVATGSCAQVRTDLSGNILKGKVKSMTEYGYDAYYGKVAHRYYTCDTATHTELITDYNEHDSVLGKTFITFDDKGHLIRSEHYTDLDSMGSKETWQYDAQGRKTRGRDVYYPFYGKHRYYKNFPNVAIDYVAFKDSMGTIYNYSYDTAGNVMEDTISMFLAPGILKVTITSYQYDGKGNKIEEDIFNCWDTNRLVVFYTDGKALTSKTTFKYDDHSRLIERMDHYQGKYDLPYEHTGSCMGSNTTYKYDKGSMAPKFSKTTAFYREHNGSITTVNLPVSKETQSKETNEYDKQGNIVKTIKDNTVVLERVITYF